MHPLTPPFFPLQHLRKATSLTVVVRYKELPVSLEETSTETTEEYSFASDAEKTIETMKPQHTEIAKDEEP